MDDMLIGFVFMSCCIDYLSGFWWGENGNSECPDRLRRLINEDFRPRGLYNAKGLFDSLRNGLVISLRLK